MLRKEQIEYALHYADDPVEWVFELVRGLEKRIDELVKYGTKVTVFQEHWHPASELPELNEYGNSELVYALYGTNNSRLSPIISCVIEGKWHDDNIKWWCYPPEEE